MATTWKQTNCSLQKDILTIEVQEVIDDVDGKKYSVSLNKVHTEDDFKNTLKSVIVIDRAKSISEDTLKTKVDLTNFETYLNT